MDDSLLQTTPCPIPEQARLPVAFPKLRRGIPVTQKGRFFASEASLRAERLMCTARRAPDAAS